MEKGEQFKIGRCNFNPMLTLAIRHDLANEAQPHQIRPKPTVLPPVKNKINTLKSPQRQSDAFSHQTSSEASLAIAEECISNDGLKDDIRKIPCLL